MGKGNTMPWTMGNNPIYGSWHANNVDSPRGHNHNLNRRKHKPTHHSEANRAAIKHEHNKPLKHLKEQTPPQILAHMKHVRVEGPDFRDIGYPLGFNAAVTSFADQIPGVFGSVITTSPLEGTNGPVRIIPGSFDKKRFPADGYIGPKNQSKAWSELVQPGGLKYTPHFYKELAQELNVSAKELRLVELAVARHFIPQTVALQLQIESMQAMQNLGYADAKIVQDNIAKIEQAKQKILNQMQNAMRQYVHFRNIIPESADAIRAKITQTGKETKEVMGQLTQTISKMTEPQKQQFIKIWNQLADKKARIKELTDETFTKLLASPMFNSAANVILLIALAVTFSTSAPTKSYIVPLNTETSQTEMIKGGAIAHKNIGNQTYGKPPSVQTANKTADANFASVSKETHKKDVKSLSQESKAYYDLTPVINSFNDAQKFADILREAYATGGLSEQDINEIFHVFEFAGTGLLSAGVILPGFAKSPKTKYYAMIGLITLTLLACVVPKPTTTPIAPVETVIPADIHEVYQIAAQLITEYLQTHERIFVPHTEHGIAKGISARKIHQGDTIIGIINEEWPLYYKDAIRNDPSRKINVPANYTKPEQWDYGDLCDAEMTPFIGFVGHSSGNQFNIVTDSAPIFLQPLEALGLHIQSDDVLLMGDVPGDSVQDLKNIMNELYPQNPTIIPHLYTYNDHHLRGQITPPDKLSAQVVGMQLQDNNNVYEILIDPFTSNQNAVNVYDPKTRQWKLISKDEINDLVQLFQKYDAHALIFNDN